MGAGCCRIEPEFNPDGTDKVSQTPEQVINDPIDARKAAKDGDTDALSELLRRMLKKQINSGAGTSEALPEDSGNTALHYVAALNHLRGVRKLLWFGADPNMRNRCGHTALHLALAGGKHKVAAYLLDHGADPNIKDGRGESVVLAAALAGRRGLVRWLLEKVQGTLDIAVSDKQGNTLFSVCARYGWHDLLADLIPRLPAQFASGVLSRRSSEGDTALGWVLKFGSTPKAQGSPGAPPEASPGRMPEAKLVEVVKQLLDAGALATAPCFKEKVHPVSLAVATGSMAVLQLLLDKGAVYFVRDALNRTPLHYAAAKGWEDMTAALLAQGLLPTSADSQGNTPLHLAASRGQLAVLKLLMAKVKDPLVAPKTPTNPVTALLVTNKAGMSVYHMALMGGHSDAAQRTALDVLEQVGESGLTSSVADTLKQDTPLLLAIASHQHDVVKVLLAKGASANATNLLGELPIARNLACVKAATAEQDAAILGMLLDAGGRLDGASETQHPLLAICKNPLSSFAEKALVVLKAHLTEGAALDWNRRDDLGRSPLVLAALYDNVYMVRYLLEVEKVEVDDRDSAGLTPLMAAARGASINAMKVLLNRRADPTAKDVAGRSALWHCMLLDKVETLTCAAMLMMMGAPPERGCNDITGESLLHRAVRYGAESFVSVWSKFGGDLTERCSLPPTADDMPGAECLAVVAEDYLDRIAEANEVDEEEEEDEEVGDSMMRDHDEEEMEKQAQGGAASRRPGAIAESVEAGGAALLSDVFVQPNSRQLRDWEHRGIAWWEDFWSDTQSQMPPPDDGLYDLEDDCAGNGEGDALDVDDLLIYHQDQALRAAKVRRECRSLRLGGPVAESTLKSFEQDGDAVMADLEFYMQDPAQWQMQGMPQRLPAGAVAESLNSVAPLSRHTSLNSVAPLSRHTSLNSERKTADPVKRPTPAKAPSSIARATSGSSCNWLTPIPDMPPAATSADYSGGIWGAVLMAENDDAASDDGGSGAGDAVELLCGLASGPGSPTGSAGSASGGGADMVLVINNASVEGTKAVLTDRATSLVRRTTSDAAAQGSAAPVSAAARPSADGGRGASFASKDVMMATCFQSVVDMGGTALSGLLDRHLTVLDPYFQTNTVGHCLYNGAPAYMDKDKHWTHEQEELHSYALQLEKRLSSYKEGGREDHTLIGADLRERNIVWWNSSLPPAELQLKPGQWKSAAKKATAAMAGARSRRPAKAGAKIKERKKTAWFGLPDLPTRPELLDTTALAYAVRLGRMSCVRALLQTSLQAVNMPDGNGYTPLCFAMYMLVNDRHNVVIQQTVDLLLAVLPQVNVNTPILMPARTDCPVPDKPPPKRDVAVDLAHNVMDPIICAALLGDAPRLTHMVLHCRGSLDMPQVHMPAISAYFKALFDKLVGGTNSMIRPLHIAILHKKLDFVRLVIDLGADVDLYAEPPDSAKVQAKLVKEAEDEAKYRAKAMEGFNPLRVTESGLVHKYHIIKRWLSKIEIPGLSKPHPWLSPLHLAARFGLAEVCQLLIARGAQPHGGAVRAFARKTPLEEALTYARKNFQKSNGGAARANWKAFSSTVEEEAPPASADCANRQAAEGLNLGAMMNPHALAMKAVALAARITLSIMLAMMKRPISHVDPALQAAHVLLLARAPVDLTNTQTEIVFRDLLDNDHQWEWVGMTVPLAESGPCLLSDPKFVKAAGGLEADVYQAQWQGYQDKLNFYTSWPADALVQAHQLLDDQNVGTDAAAAAVRPADYQKKHKAYISRASNFYFTTGVKVIHKLYQASARKTEHQEAIITGNQERALADLKCRLEGHAAAAAALLEGRATRRSAAILAAVEELGSGREFEEDEAAASTPQVACQVSDSLTPGPVGAVVRRRSSGAGSLSRPSLKAVPATAKQFKVPTMSSGHTNPTAAAVARQARAAELGARTAATEGSFDRFCNDAELALVLEGRPEMCILQTNDHRPAFDDAAPDTDQVAVVARMARRDNAMTAKAQRLMKRKLEGALVGLVTLSPEAVEQELEELMATLQELQEGLATLIDLCGMDGVL